MLVHRVLAAASALTLARRLVVLVGLCRFLQMGLLARLLLQVDLLALTMMEQEVA